jgi:uncharacterized membrane protein
MSNDPTQQESPDRISERIDYLESSLRDLIVRIYTIEQKLGLRLVPVEQPQAPAPEKSKTETIKSSPQLAQLEVEKDGGTVIELEPKKPLPPPAQQTPAIMEPVIQAPTIKEIVEQKQESQVDIVAIPPASKQKSKDDRYPLPRPEPVETIVQPLVSSGNSSGRNIESMIGGTWFNRIGIVAIILAVGYFLQYAFTVGWIGPSGRVAVGVIIGIGLVVLGERIIRRGYRSYAQGISGGGIAILYLAFFAAFARYQLIDQKVGFIFMSAVTVLAVLLAARHDALTIAILGLIGGFLTPIMLSTGSDNETGLFTYIALLDVGVLALAYFKQWRVLNYLAFGATVLMAAGWWATWYEAEKLWLTIFFFTLFFLIFAALAILHNVVNHRPTRALDLGLILANASIYFGTSYQLLDEDNYGYLGLFAVLMATFYLGLGYFTFKRDREDRYLILTFLGLATIFLTLAIPIQLDQNWVTMAWAIQGAVFTWIGFRANNRTTRYAALIVFSISLYHWFSVDFGEFAFGRGGTFTPFINRRGFSAFVLIASLGIAVRLYRRYNKSTDGVEKEGFGSACMLAANILALFWLSTDLVDYFNQQISLVPGSDFDDRGASATRQLENSRLFAISMLWTIYGAIALVIGIIRNSPLLRGGAFVLLTLATLKVVVLDAAYHTAGHTPIFNQTFLAFAMLAGAYALGTWFYKRNREIDQGERSLAIALMVVLANLLAIIGLSLEVRGYYIAELRLQGNEKWQMLEENKQFLLTALWAVYAAVALVIGIVRNSRLLRYGAFLLLGLATLKVLVLDVGYHATGHPPIFNQTFIAFAMLVGAFALGTWLYKRNRKIDEGERSFAIALMIGIANLLAIIGLSLEVRGYYKFRQVDEQWRMLEESKQFMLTAIWTVYGTAAMIIGLRRGTKMIRYGALGLLWLAVFKVLSIDIRFAATPGHTPVFNKTFGAFIVLVAGLGFSLWLFSRSEGFDKKERAIIRNGMTIAVNLLAIIGLSAEAYGFFEWRIMVPELSSDERLEMQLAQKLSLSVVWAIYGGAMLLYGIWHENRLLRRMALGLLSLTIAKVFIFDIAGLDKIYRIAAFFILGAILLVVSFKYQQWQRREAEERR